MPARRGAVLVLACLPAGLCRGVGAYLVGDPVVQHPFADQGVLF